MQRRDQFPMQRRAAIITALRTPVGRHAGALASVRPDDLAAHVIKAVVARSGIDPALIEDVYFGATNQAGEDNRNVARMAALLAGLPVSVPGSTVNRLCASGLEAVNIAARMIEWRRARLQARHSRRSHAYHRDSQSRGRRGRTLDRVDHFSPRRFRRFRYRESARETRGQKVTRSEFDRRPDVDDAPEHRPVVGSAICRQHH